MFVPGVSTTDVLGYQMLINDANSNAVPSKVVYDGSEISSVLQITVQELVSG